MIDLGGLPAPNVLETLSFEEILREYKALARERLVSILPNWNPDLESDPIVMVLEACAYRELVTRARVNDAARSNLLAFAIGGDLDHLVAFYGVERLADETDQALRTRTQARIVGWANAGGAAHYRYWAMTASPQVRDATVSSPQPGHVQIAVWARADEAATLEAVRGQISRDDIRVLTDTVSVTAATPIAVPIVAQVWLYPETPQEVLDRLPGDISAAIDGARGLGWSLTRSWIIGRLQVTGVQRVELIAPAHDITVAPNSYVTLMTATIALAGRAR
jgi:phage-related baseplate assembly protein